jgi:hypothetical protein
VSRGDAKDAMPRRKPDAKLTGISEETSKRLRARSAAYVKMTQRRGAPMVYGAGAKAEARKRD